MKLQQLRYVWEVAHHELNVSLTAQSLYTSQPGISKQIRLLEDELGVEIFARSGKHLTRITPAGEKILKIVGEILQDVENIKNIALEYSEEQSGVLTIATTDTLARYALPSVISGFIEKYPDVSLQLHHGSTEEIAQMVMEGQADLVVATESLEKYRDIFTMPCHQSDLTIVTNPNHPLAKCERVQLEELALYPIVTYTEGLDGREQLDQAFAEKRLQSRIVITAADADVIKTYARLGLGVGVIADIALDKEKDHDLVAINASNLFASSVSKIGYRRGTYLRGYVYDFIQMFSPELNSEAVKLLYAGKAGTQGKLESLDSVDSVPGSPELSASA